MRVAGVTRHAQTEGLVKERHTALWWAGNITRGSLIYGVLIVTALAFLYPYFWMVGNAFKTNEGFYTDPYRLIPEEFSLGGMKAALGVGRVHIYLKNSTIFAVVGVSGQLLVDALAAFAFARLKFRGRDVMFVLVLATLMLPYSVVLIPSYLIVFWFGLANTYAGVMLPGFAGAFGIFLLRQFFLNIPSELEDAARDRRRIHAQNLLADYRSVGQACLTDVGTVHLHIPVEFLRVAADRAEGLGQISIDRRHSPVQVHDMDILAEYSGRHDPWNAASDNGVLAGSAVHNRRNHAFGTEGVSPGPETTRIIANGLR